MARKSKEDFENTKQRLLEVGLSLFEHKGYNATGLQEIVNEANISKGSFYTYFSSKEDFGVAVIRYYTETSLSTWKDMLVKAIEKEDSYSALLTTFLLVAEKFKDVDNKKGCLLGNLSAEISEASDVCRVELHESVKKNIVMLTKHIRIGQELGKVRDDLPAERLANLVWDCWQGSLLKMKIVKSVDPVINDLTLLFEHVLLPN